MRLLPKGLDRKALAWFAPALVFLAYWLGRTVRIRAYGYDRYLDSTQCYIFCTWHGRLFVGSRFLQRRGLTAMVSLSRDGDWISRLFIRWGYEPIRGSSGKGGARVFVEAIKSLRAGKSMAITPDGPRGPAQKVKDGILKMAQTSGVAIVPTSSSARWRLHFPSWDRFLIPLPFSPGVMVFGEPIVVTDLEQGRVQVEKALDEAQRQADAL